LRLYSIIGTCKAARLGLGQSAIVWVDQKGHDFRGWEKLMQQFQPLCRNLYDQAGHACYIAARLV
jgi:hypothetical protein